MWGGRSTSEVRAEEASPLTRKSPPVRLKVSMVLIIDGNAEHDDCSEGKKVLCLKINLKYATAVDLNKFNYQFHFTRKMNPILRYHLIL